MEDLKHQDKIAKVKVQPSFDELSKFPLYFD